MEFTFLTARPAKLERYVESIWYARGQIDYRRERIAPTGSTVAVIVLGAPIKETADDGRGEAFVADAGFLLGPHDRPVVNEPLGETYCLGIVSTPIGCRALFGVAPAGVRGRVVDLASVWPPATTLREDLLTISEPHEMLERVGQVLLDGLQHGGVAADRCEAAVAALEVAPTRGVRDIAAELGVTHGHLDRDFIEVVGLSPRTMARICRMRALLGELDVYAPISWSSLAAEYGWFDQSHFIRDFKRHVGVTPSEYVDAQRRIFAPDESGPGFVPQT